MTDNKPEQFRQRIIHEDADLLVLNKPAGAMIHGDRSHVDDETLLALAIEHLGASAFSDFKPAFAHRLDKDTSGVLVLAKTREALRSLHRQIKFKEVQKTYLALLAGESRESGSIRFALKKVMDRKRWLALMKPTRRGGIFAHTEYERTELLLWGGGKFSFVEAHPKTGRTHQLRAHFAAIGNPIVGDDLYGNAELNERWRKELGVQRHMLHAAAIEFAHPMSGKTVRYEAPLPEDFRAVLRKIKKN